MIGIHCAEVAEDNQGFGENNGVGMYGVWHLKKTTIGNTVAFGLTDQAVLLVIEILVNALTEIISQLQLPNSKQDVECHKLNTKKPNGREKMASNAGRVGAMLHGNGKLNADSKHQNH